jgi:streptomycin 6-kinase
VFIPPHLVAACKRSPERGAWLESLPETIRNVRDAWSLSLGRPFTGHAHSCSWVAPAIRADGARVVLKLGMPHMEGRHEADGLRFWNGDPTVRLLEENAELNAMLLESCEPGVALRNRPEDEQDVIIATLLRRLWRRPPTSHPFRPLAAMIDHWTEETRGATHAWSDPGLVQAGLQLFNELARQSSDDVLLATDLHAGNVLSAQREPWLVIDPKPFVGDRSYDATQHLFNSMGRMLTAPDSTIRRFAELLEIEHERLRLWMFARAAAEPREIWTEELMALARSLERR